MTRKKSKIGKKILKLLVLLLLVGFILNWFLTYRLEKFLRKELSERVTKATGGFYDLDFEKLDIGLFNGELEMSNVVFRPDSGIFKEWLVRDSLPETFLDLTIDKIHFKGVNLTWRFSYKKLDFDLFEITRPVVSIYSSDYSSRVINKSKYTTDKTLYELIEPYINVLTVRTMNLENASVSYITDLPGEISALTSIYGLKNVSFHAYGFRLDSDSYASGKLLYCDNFDFTTNESQTLLLNNQMVLNADSIRLSTRDSLIQISKIDLIPQKMLWAQSNRVPDNYVDAKIKSIQVKGIWFVRDNARNYLKATTFDIDTSEMEYFEIKKDSVEDKTKNTPDTIDLSWSLYDIVSPLLSRIAIDKIGVKNARFGYSEKSASGTDSYKLTNFNFNAYGFMIDSLTHKQKKYLYSENFDIEASGINGTMISKNHIFNIEHMLLNTAKGIFNIKDVKVWPVSTKTNLDYLQGSVDSIKIGDLVYDKGIKAKELSIDAPSVQYVKMPGTVLVQKKDTVNSAGVSNTIDLITLFFNYLSIDKINLNNGDITFIDKRTKEQMIYKVPKLDFYASNILLNKQTVTHSDSYFTYEDIKFSFEHFDNLLPGKNYRLKIRSALYSGQEGDMRLKDVKLIPQTDSWKKAPGTYMNLDMPLLDIIGISYKLNKKESTLAFKTFNMNSPRAKIVKTGNSDKQPGDNDKKSIPFNIRMGSFNISDANVIYTDNTKKDSVDFSIKKIMLDKLSWLSGKELLVGDILLDQPKIFKKSLFQNDNVKVTRSTSSLSILPRIFSVNNVNISGMGLGLEEPDLKFSSTIPSILVQGISHDGSRFGIKNISVSKPSVNMDRNLKPEEVRLSPEEKSAGVYAMLGNFAEIFSIEKFNVADAEIDYRNTQGGEPVNKQKLNSTNLNFTGLEVNSKKELFNIDDFNFNIKDLNFPIDNGFYTLHIGEVDMHKRDRAFTMNDLHLKPIYSPVEFTFKHPRQKDWFDIYVGKIILSEIDYPNYFKDRILNVKDAQIDNVKLLNYRNQKVTRPHRKVPMIYEGLQKLPLKLDIENLGVHNFMVQYEELPKKGDEAARIFFTDMNGVFKGFTNIVKHPQQYIELNADGNLMGKGHFNARWLLPVDSLNDRFLLTAFLGKFDLKELNQLISPLTPAEVAGGTLDTLIFKTEATSKGARVQMRFLYNGLKVNFLKNKDGNEEPNRFMSGLANLVIRSNNPNKRGKTPREPLLSLERDPYHSTFNYLWQILRPPLVESVGVPQRTQNFFKRVGGFINKVKNFFKVNKKEPETNENLENRPG